VWPARGVLVLIGLCGGMFLVPINAALQDIGHRTIGSGRAVALQSFFENSAMLTSVAIYTAAVALGAQPVQTIVVVGVLVLIATTLVSWHLPPDPVASLQAREAASDSGSRN
jgi:LPLT family lysophospholipid transporter-like MFS transporter